MRGMLGIFEKLFRLYIVELPEVDRDDLSAKGSGSNCSWHEDVQMFSVLDDDSEGNGFMRYLYTGLHPREGKLWSCCKV